MEDKKRLTKPYGEYSARHLRRIIKRTEKLVKPFRSASKSLTVEDIPQNSPCSLPAQTVAQHFSNLTVNAPPIKGSSTKYIPEANEETCTKENKESIFLKHLTSWFVEHHISHNAFNKLLLILKLYLDLKDCPRDSRTLLRVDKTQKNEVITVNPGSYYHFGLSSGIVFTLNKIGFHNLSEDFNNFLSVSINVDGLPLTKSSNSQFWPILGSLDNVKNGSPFPIGVYHGNGKPDDANIYLKPFVSEYKNVQQSGLIFNNTVYKIKLSKVLCDAPAKAYILNIKNHNAYNSCTKCLVEGDYIKNRMAFLDLNSPLRSNEDFKNLRDENFHKGSTILSQTDIGLVTDIPLNYMDLVCLGVCKKLITLWLRGCQGIRLFKEDIDIIDANLEYYRKFVVKEFARLPRSLKEIDRWKSTELRQFLLYYGPLAVMSVLKEPLLSHFLTLHVAMRTLVSKHLSKKYIKYAESLLLYFVKKIGEIYGNEYVNHNVHNLLHLCNDVKKFGPLDNFSCFQFENYMSVIKKSLKTSNFPLQQFVNRYYEYKTHQIFGDSATEFNLSREMGPKEIDGENVLIYGEVKYKNSIFTISEPNCYCIIKCGTVIKLSCFFTKNGIIFFKGKKFSDLNNYFETPCPSINVYCGSVNDLTEDIVVLRLDDILYKYAVVQFENNSISVIPSVWIVEDGMQKGAYWSSSKNLRTLIIKLVKPDEEKWPFFKISKIIGKYDTYEQALKIEKNAAASSSDEAPPRDPGKRKIKPGKAAYSPPPSLSNDDGSSDDALQSVSSDQENEIFVDLDETVKSQVGLTTHEDSTSAEESSPLNKDIEIEIIDTEVSTVDILKKLEEIDNTLKMILYRLNNLEITNQHISQDIMDDNLVQSLPLKTVEELLKFEDTLDNNKDAFKQLENKYLHQGGKNPPDFTRRCLSITFSNNLATVCSWTGQKQNFKIKDCLSVAALRNSIKKVFVNFTHSEFEKCIMEWFRHAHQRCLREKQ